MKRRLPSWMVEDTMPQSDKNTNRCAVQPLFATDDTTFLRSFSPPPADSTALPDNQHQIRILRPSQINSTILNNAEVPTISNVSGSDLGIQANDQEENGTNQEKDIKMEDDDLARTAEQQADKNTDTMSTGPSRLPEQERNTTKQEEDIKMEEDELTLLEQLESNINGNDTSDISTVDQQVDSQVDRNAGTTSAGPSCLPDVVPHALAQPEIKTEPAAQSVAVGTAATVKVEPPAAVPISPVQTSTNSALRVSCNFGVQCFRYVSLTFDIYKSVCDEYVFTF